MNDPAIERLGNPDLRLVNEAPYGVLVPSVDACDCIPASDRYGGYSLTIARQSTTLPIVSDEARANTSPIPER